MNELHASKDMRHPDLSCILWHGTTSIGPSIGNPDRQDARNAHTILRLLVTKDLAAGLSKRMHVAARHLERPMYECRRRSLQLGGGLQHELRTTRPLPSPYKPRRYSPSSDARVSTPGATLLTLVVSRAPMLLTLQAPFWTRASKPANDRGRGQRLFWTPSASSC